MLAERTCIRGTVQLAMMNMRTLISAGKVWADAQRPGASLFVLVDTSGLPQLRAQLRQHAALAARNLFESTREHAAMSVAPVLIDLGALDRPADPQALRLLDWLLTQCVDNHTLTLLRSTRTLDQLAVALTKRLDAELPQQVRVLMRYFDTRVLGALMQTLQPDQAAEFFGIADRWSWFDRNGVLQHQQTDELPHADTFKSPLQLSQQQEAQLLEAAEPDAVMQLMRQIAPDECVRVSAGALHASITQCLPAAQSLGIDDPRQQALFCLTELLHGPQFFSQPLWQEALLNIDREARGFLSVLDKMESRV